ncbi:MAG: S9 family peptidase, partial [Planctomycetes bacterium]|nr:S9 family peptidase [Planctomycetota bacterium]
RKVSIANYRDRFMKVREVDRHVSDDPIPDRDYRWYLYRIGDPALEDGDLYRLHGHHYTGPRDIMGSPEWSLDSSRIAFLVHEQSSDQVSVYESRLADLEPEPEPKTKTKDEDSARSGSEEGEEKLTEDLAKKAAKSDEPRSVPARLISRFLHAGGPNTPRMMSPRYLADHRRLVMLTEQSGFRQLHILDPVYESLDQLTRGRFEVYPVDLSKDRKTMFALSTRDDSTRVALYRVDLESGAMSKLSSAEGTYADAAVSPDGSRFLANFVSYGRLSELVLGDVQAGSLKDLTDSHPESTKKLLTAKPTFISYDNRHGHQIHGMLFEPPDRKADDKRPLLIYVYGGPLGTRKQVNDGSYGADAYLFASYLAHKHGFVTCTIDPRGMSGYGGVFEKANFERVGKPQVEDLVDGVKYLVANHGVDPEHVGIHGWSFGGFQTQMCLFTEPDVFKVGIAGAGPTEWENYNSWYSTGTIGDSRPGEVDLKKFSLLPLAKNLKGKLLLVHGMEDPNVLYQDTVRVYRELLKAGKETLVELFLDPTGGHGLGGDVKRLNRYRKYEEFLLRTLR